MSPVQRNLSHQHCLSEASAQLELSSFRVVTMVVKISFSGWERGSLFVAYFAQYFVRRDTQSTLARHADSLVPPLLGGL